MKPAGDILGFLNPVELEHIHFTQTVQKGKLPFAVILAGELTPYYLQLPVEGVVEPTLFCPAPYHDTVKVVGTAKGSCYSFTSPQLGDGQFEYLVYPRPDSLASPFIFEITHSGRKEIVPAKYWAYVDDPNIRATVLDSIDAKKDYPHRKLTDEEKKKWKDILGDKIVGASVEFNWDKALGWCAVPAKCCKRRFSIRTTDGVLVGRPKKDDTRTTHLEIHLEPPTSDEKKPTLIMREFSRGSSVHKTFVVHKD
jgi:hypothetical protein